MISPRQRLGLSLATVVAAACAVVTIPAAQALPAIPLAAAECGDFGCLDDQPRLSAKVPPAAPAGAYATGDFDSDGVVNKADNCVLVPNADQQPAARPAGATEDPLAVEWKQQHPGAMFRLNSELGEACSGWNGNWHRTEMSLKLAPEPVAQQIYRFLGEGGPMFGDDKLMYGGPVCTDVNDGWVNMIEYALRWPEYDIPLAETPEFDCRTGEVAEGFTDWVEANVWGGKRLFTPTNSGGEITNRFFAPVTENAGFQPIIDQFPSVFPHGAGQTVRGDVLRGQSYKDGRQAILLDWRNGDVGGFRIGSNATPIGSYLAYDECRAIQEGIWPCNANMDMVRKPFPGDRKLFQFGWMFFQSIDPSIQNWEAWEQANPEWTTPEAYGYPS